VLLYQIIVAVPLSLSASKKEYVQLRSEDADGVFGIIVVFALSGALFLFI